MTTFSTSLMSPTSPLPATMPRPTMATLPATFNTILVPLDGSPLGEHAIPYAAALARAAGGRLVLVHAAHDAAERRHIETDLADLAERLWKGGAQVETHVRYGSPATVITQATVTWEAGLVAMSTHGRSGLGRWLYGSVAEAVLRRSPVPVLLVPATCEGQWRPASPEGRRPRLVVPLDGSATAERALATACALAGVTGAELHLARVVPPPPALEVDAEEQLVWGYSLAMGPLSPPETGGGVTRRAVAPETRVHPDAQDVHEMTEAGDYLDAVAAGLRTLVAPVKTHVLAGPPAVELADLARRCDADLVVMATHGRAGLARLALGSVATAVLRRAPVPLVLVGPSADA